MKSGMMATDIAIQMNGPYTVAILNGSNSQPCRSHDERQQHSRPREGDADMKDDAKYDGGCAPGEHSVAERDGGNSLPQTHERSLIGKREHHCPQAIDHAGEQASADETGQRTSSRRGEVDGGSRHGHAPAREWNCRFERRVWREEDARARRIPRVTIAS